MPARVTCQTCGTGVDAQFARVYGTEDDDVYACLSCSTHRALANGAAIAPDRDGTPLVHRPDRDEPVPATLDEADTDDDEPDRYVLAELSTHHGPSESEDRSSHDDEAFAALVAE